MPHIIIEYSANVRDRIRLGSLIERLHATAIGTGVFPLGGARTRAAERSDYRIADGHPDNGFVHVTMRMGHGRDADTKARAAQTVFDALCEHLAPLFDAAPLGISFEVQEIDPVLNFKKNNLHEYVKARQAGREKP
jgi:5-carboxymethyl-2-hydroxymuconate isomerase